jgi:uncharacterized protein YoxC
MPYHICFAWTGEYEALKKLLSEDLKLTGIWEQPDGDKKVFRTNDTSISWRKSKSLLHLEGTDAGKITQLLCTKICEDLNAVSKTNNIIISDCSCQTESDISQSCLCKCKDICHDIEGLKSGQKVTSEAIQSLSKAVSHIAETFTHFQEDMHVKINRGNKSKATRKRNLQESLQEFNMQESSNNHNSIETIEIIEAINSTDPKVNDTPLQTNTTESIEITEASNSTDPKACYIPTVQINTNLGTQPKNSTNVASTPKHLVPCPFLRRKGHCLKGKLCQ